MMRSKTPGPRIRSVLSLPVHLGPRFLDFSGLDAATLRAQAGERHLLAAALAFLEAHEPSLLAAAAALDIKPAALVAASTELGN